MYVGKTKVLISWVAPLLNLNNVALQYKNAYKNDDRQTVEYCFQMMQTK